MHIYRRLHPLLTSTLHRNQTSTNFLYLSTVITIKMKSFITIITLLTAFAAATPAASSQTKACTRPCFPEATECGEGWVCYWLFNLNDHALTRIRNLFTLV